MQTNDVLEAFQLLETWEERYELITELGSELLPLSASERTDENLIAGCTTRTWLSGRLMPGDPPTLQYRADAEGPLVRGLVALLLMPFQGKTPRQVLDTDPSGFLDALRLREALSAKRRAGMEAFLDRVKRIARDT
jgi:cysteine desulfuration protein SufE